ncbi:MAG TPA: hypothetical protein QGG47_06410 [Acidobacteriota bacterium]|nr:hypothetical protein [Acidobacteriota bacterium]
MKLLRRIVLWVGIGLMLTAVFSCGAAPVRWYLKEASPWRVLVVDKTVPHPDYREHKALFWVLRHDKVGNPTGERGWPLNRDYIGFSPDPDDTQSHGTWEDLSPGHLANANMLYLADSYGVYRGDYESERPNMAGLDYSALIYGGLKDHEVDAVEEFGARGGHIVAEFNTFASPTSGEARARLQNLFGLDWSGWTGRYFRDLSEESEVPLWAYRNWKEHYGLDWELEGPGYLLVHEDTRLFVLRLGREIDAPGLTIERRDGGRITEDVTHGLRFNYWFDIVSARPQASVPADFHLAVNEAGRETLQRFGVPDTFPAVVVASEAPLRAYFAGDFSDSIGTLGPHWAEGVPWLNQRIVGLWFPSGADQEPFYWGFYIPLLRGLLSRVSP